MFELVFQPYEYPETVGYKGAYIVAGECVGFLTLDDKFLSMARCYGVELVDTPPTR
jgi:hypothetical protein